MIRKHLTAAAIIGITSIALVDCVSNTAHVKLNEEVTFGEAVALHDAGRNGDTRALAQAVEAFGNFVDDDQNDALAHAYLGSSYALTARDRYWYFPPIKLYFVYIGLHHLDTAVDLEPNNFVTLLIRANVQVGIPAMFLRRDNAVEDMLALDAMFSQIQSQELASDMVDIYNHLSETVPEADDWAAKAQSARQLAGQ